MRKTKLFEFINRWDKAHMNSTQGDRIDIGFFGDWSDKDISIRFRIGRCFLFSGGYSWKKDVMKFYICIMNFQVSLNKYIWPKEVNLK